MLLCSDIHIRPPFESLTHTDMDGGSLEQCYLNYQKLAVEAGLAALGLPERVLASIVAQALARPHARRGTCMHESYIDCNELQITRLSSYTLYLHAWLPAGCAPALHACARVADTNVRVTDARHADDCCWSRWLENVVCSSREQQQHSQRHPG